MIVCAIILIMPGGCVSISEGDFCRLYLPVYTDTQDTEETLTQIDRNNAVWLETCLL
jgi:hypothetical protein